MKTTSIWWLKGAMALGLALAVLLVAEAVITYHSLTSHLLPDHFTRLAGSYVSQLESQSRQEELQGLKHLKTLVDQFVAQESGQIAWLRILDQQGAVLAQSGALPDWKFSAAAAETILELQAQSVTEVRETSQGKIFVVAMPFRFRLAPMPSGGPDSIDAPAQTQGPQGTRERRPRFNLAEIGLYLYGQDNPFGPLRRNLAISIAAALALLGSIVLLLVRLPSYLQGKHLEQQLAIARQVQQDLLPHSCPECESLDFAAECLPAWQVGGDYYDIRWTSDGRIGLALGDVSGKGLPAALLMGLVHGALRTCSRLGRVSHAKMVQELNRILWTSSSPEHYSSLFWAYYDPESDRLSYVNAGHLPALLVRRDSDGAPLIEALERGGTVVGLLPNAEYEEGTALLQKGDLLVLYSDGVVEAMNSFDEEFGKSRLIQILQAEHEKKPSEILKTIRQRVAGFVGSREQSDDLTLLIVRVGLKL
ncbi:MAG: PP2C family protein-serine/threonine phosphatase [Acidobacteriota bacterium]